METLAGLAANSQTTASWVADLRAGGAVHWVTATAAPCTSLYKPVKVTSPLDLAPEPSDRYDPAALWWRHEVLHRLVMRDPAAASALFRPERDAVQARWLAGPPDPAAAFAEADELLARWIEAVAARPGGRDTRPAWARRYWQEEEHEGRAARADSTSRDGTTSELIPGLAASGVRARGAGGWHGWRPPGPADG